MGWSPNSFNLAHRPCILWTLLPFSFIPHPLPYPYKNPLWKPFMIYWAPFFPPRAFLVAQTIKNLPAMWETWVWSMGWEDPLQKGIAIHSSILAWRIPWTEEPGGLQSMGLQRVGHNWSTNTFTLFFLRQNSLFHLIFRATVSTGYYYYFHLKYDLKIGRDVEKLDQGLSTIRYWTCIQVGAGLQRHILSFCPKLCFILFSAWPATPQLSKLSSAITSSKLVFNFAVLPSRLLPSVLSSSA